MEDNFRCQQLLGIAEMRKVQRHQGRQQTQATAGETVDGLASWSKHHATGQQTPVPSSLPGGCRDRERASADPATYRAGEGGLWISQSGRSQLSDWSSDQRTCGPSPFRVAAIYLQMKPQ